MADHNVDGGCEPEAGKAVRRGEPGDDSGRGRPGRSGQGRWLPTDTPAEDGQDCGNMKRMFDSHAHYDSDARFDADRDDLLAGAAGAGD